MCFSGSSSSAKFVDPIPEKIRVRPAELVTKRGEPLDPFDTLREPSAIRPLKLFEPLLDRDRSIRLPEKQEPCLRHVLYSGKYTMIGMITSPNQSPSDVCRPPVGTASSDTSMGRSPEPGVTIHYERFRETA